MKNWLLFLAVVALAIASPAYSQTAFLDVNGDGLSSLMPGNEGLPDDVLLSSTTSIDVYFITNLNPDGSAAVCPSNEAFEIGSYEGLLRSVGSGTVTFTGWTDAMGFPTPVITLGNGTFHAAGNDAWFGRGGAPPNLPPGKYKLGTVGVTVSGANPMVVFVQESSMSGNAQTAFGTICDGVRFDNTYRMGDPVGDPPGLWDWPTANSFGTEPTIPVVPTTWGKIKNLYR